MLENVIRPLGDELKKFLLDGILLKFQEVSSTCLGVLVGYLIMLFVITVFIWRPFLSYSDKIDLKVKKMLAMIPL